MSRIIILEGPDGSGKTSLYKLMKKELKRKKHIYVHEGVPPEGSKLHYYAAKLQGLLDQKRPVIIDRFHLGELVYSHINRGGTNFGYREFRIFRRLLAANDVNVTICLPPYANALAAWKKRLAEGKEYLVEESKYQDAYHRFQGLSAYDRSWDYTKMNSELAAQVLTAFLVQKPTALPNGVIGSKRAKVLFVGEVANHPTLDLPFFSMEHSSGLLNSSIWEAGFSEEDIAFVNARKITGWYNDLAEIGESLPNLECAVALGKVAQQACKDAKVNNIHSMPHPAFLKRFEAGKKEDFVDRLVEVRFSLN